MAHHDGNGKVSFGWKEWLGILGSMLVLVTVPMGTIQMHASDTQRHQTAQEKMELLKELMEEERALFRREMDHDRELMIQRVLAHENLGGHVKMETRWLEHDRRLGKLED